MPMHIRPELLQQNSVPHGGAILTNGTHSGYVTNDGFNSVVNNNGVGSTDVQSDHQEEAMFELIKAHCVGNASLFKRIVHWGMKNRSRRRVSQQDVSSLSEGRLWVTAHPADFVEGA